MLVEIYSHLTSLLLLLLVTISSLHHGLTGGLILAAWHWNPRPGFRSRRRYNRVCTV